MRKPLAAALGFFLLLPAVSTAEPSVQETVDYLNNSYASCEPIVRREQVRRGGGNFTRTTIYDRTIISVDNNKIIMNESIRYVSSYHGSESDSFFRKICLVGSDNLPRWSRRYGRDTGLCPAFAQEYTFRASALTSSLSTEVDMEGNRLAVQCHSGKECAKTVKKGREINWDGERKQINERASSPANYIPVCKNRGNKLRKAFSHLIKLLGGKKELF